MSAPHEAMVFFQLVHDIAMELVKVGERINRNNGTCGRIASSHIISDLDRIGSKCHVVRDILKEYDRDAEARTRERVAKETNSKFNHIIMETLPEDAQ